ncbi:hypothetical protein GCM10023204_17450 [Actinomycetospora succinea]
MDSTGPTDTGDDGRGRDLSRDPLELACEDINFAHSMARDAHRLRDRVLDVLVDLSLGWDRTAARLERTAAIVGPGAAQERLRAAADRALAHRGDARWRWRRLAAVAIGERPPPGP